MKNIYALNFTVQELTEDQKKDGGIETSDYIKLQIIKYLDLVTAPLDGELEYRAKKIVELMISSIENIFLDPCNHLDIDRELCVMIDSTSAALSYYLIKEMLSKGIKPCFPNLEREIVEFKNDDGAVGKRYSFKYKGFYTL